MKSVHSQAAAAIRKELKACFPDVKFSVRSDSFSMGNAVDVYWDLGPTTKQIEEVVNKYQYGSFDGMTDSYNYTNRRTDIPQVKYVMANRQLSGVRSLVQGALREVLPQDFDRYEIELIAARIISRSSVPVGASITGVVRVKTGGTVDECFALKLRLADGTETDSVTAGIFDGIENHELISYRLAGDNSRELGVELQRRAVKAVKARKPGLKVVHSAIKKAA